jgi:hypothetical protein
MNIERQPPARDKLLELADLLLEGTAGAAEVEELEALLAQNPAAQRAYIRYTLVHGQLPLTSAALQQPPDVRVEPVACPTPTASVHKRRTTGFGRVAAVALSLAAAVLIAVSLWPSLPSRVTREGKGAHENALANRMGELPYAERGSPHYDHRDLPKATVATLRPAPADNMPASRPTRPWTISPTTLTVDQGEARFASAGGADVRVEGPAMFGVSSQTGGVLFGGSVRARLERPASTYSVLASNLRVVDLGTEFRVTVVDDEHVNVHVLDGEVDVQARVRLPLYYWNFDAVGRTPGGAVGAGETRLSLGRAVRRVAGLVGGGALAFDNTMDSFVRVEGGTGEEVGTGGMACTSGISIEAMFVSRWAGGFRDYDEIFRKEDGIYRILLSFQNDDWDYDVPPVAAGPCLSFGLHLEQHGYSELDLPLDGREGRPRVADLTDGKPHHVVATYDSFTGRKAIYIDGQPRFEHTFPVGSLVLSGGPAPAEVGNTRRHEPFHGILDEVAFYDFALTSDEVAAHFRSASSGRTYFGAGAEQLQSARWHSVTHIHEGGQRVFNKFTGLPVDAGIVHE